MLYAIILTLDSERARRIRAFRNTLAVYPCMIITIEQALCHVHSLGHILSQLFTMLN